MVAEEHRRRSQIQDTHQMGCRVFGIDIETCPACGGAVRIVACIEDPDVIEKILNHLEEKSPGSVPPGLPPSRASPQIGLFS